LYGRKGTISRGGAGAYLKPREGKKKEETEFPEYHRGKKGGGFLVANLLFIKNRTQRRR